MGPFIRDGAGLTVQPVASSSVRVGDIVLCKRGQTLSAHRIVAFTGTGSAKDLLIRGDAHWGDPQRVSLKEVIGVVVSIRRGRRSIDLRSWGWRTAGLVWVKATPVGQILMRWIYLVRIAARGIVLRFRVSRSESK
jgi:hypothetical protein